MNVDGENMCIGCMNPLNQNGECDVCHFSEKDYHPAPRCLLPGTKLAERYVLGCVLGEGNFGITYIAWDTFLGGVVAIKEYFVTNMVTRNIALNSDTNTYIFEGVEKQEYERGLEKYLNEAKCLSMFNQVEGIVSVRDFFYENNTGYIIMDYIDGISVKDSVLTHGKMEPDMVLELMRPVFLALEKVHKAGLIHRDISPDNLLLTRENKLVLIDFGTARMTSTLDDKTMTVVFKRGYSPTEQYLAKGPQGPWSDVYSLCATLYYMLTGQAPNSAIERSLVDELPSLLDMPEIEMADAQKRIIMRGMAVNAKSRFQTIDALQQALFETRTHQKKGKLLAVGAGIMLVVLGISISSVITTFYAEKSGESMETAVEKTIQIQQTEAPITKYTMISLIGETKEDAIKKSQSLQNTHVSIQWKSEYSDKVKKNDITRQSIPEGREYTDADKLELTVWVSKGMKKVRVPDVVGKSYQKAKEILKSRSLTCRIIWSQSSKKKGTVMTQSKSGGTKVKKNALVILHISKGKAVSTKEKTTHRFAAEI